jgi:hypothetical protein
MSTTAPAPNAARTTTAAVQAEMARGNFVRAAEIAASLGLPAADLRKVRFEALWQMASNRNAPGTRKLALRYGISRAELKQFLEARARQLRANGHSRGLGPCYDAATGRYLPFEEWLELHSEEWDQSAPAPDPRIPAAWSLPSPSFRDLHLGGQRG